MPRREPAQSATISGGGERRVEREPRREDVVEDRQPRDRAPREPELELPLDHEPGAERQDDGGRERGEEVADDRRAAGAERVRGR